MNKNYLLNLGLVFVLLASLVLPVNSANIITLNGAGATFPYPIYSKWFDEYHKIKSEVQINYQSIGSGGGIKQILEHTVDFGASDGPMNDEQLAKSDGKIQPKEIKVLHEFVLKELALFEPTIDSSGMNQAFYADFEFDVGVEVGDLLWG